MHVIAPRNKGDGVTRVIYENPNGFNSRINHNEKLEKAKEIIDKLEADVAPPTSSLLMWLSVLVQRYRCQLDVNGRFTLL